MRIDEIIAFLEEKAPKDIALDFDNVGLLVGRRGKNVTKILTALDCTESLVLEAASLGAEMIVCHHPIMFSGVKKITDETAEGRMILGAAEKGIAIYAAHTNLDFAPGGLNDYFLKLTGFSPLGEIEDGEGRVFETGDMTAGEVCERIKAALGLSYVRTTMEKDRSVRKGALCTGGGKSLAKGAAKIADFYISGDLGHHDILNLSDSGCGYIELSHFDSEKIVMRLLKELLDERFKGGIEVIISETNRNPFKSVI